MNLNRKHPLVTMAIAAVMSFTSAHAQDTTPDSVKTRIGDLKVERGFPTEETKHKVFDEIDYQRAVQARSPTRPRCFGWEPLAFQQFPRPDAHPSQRDDCIHGGDGELANPIGRHEVQGS